MKTKKYTIALSLAAIAIVIVVAFFFTKTSEAPSEISGESAEVNQLETNADAEDWQPPRPATNPPPESISEPTVSNSATPSMPAELHTIPSQENLAEEVIVPNSVVVIFDGGRFIPAEATIAEGGMVHFVNNSTEDMWVASDNHPRRDRYPLKDNALCGTTDFDQCQAVGPGQRWTFTFNRSGTWGYHNFADAKDTGKVVVVDRDEL